MLDIPSIKTRRASYFFPAMGIVISLSITSLFIKLLYLTCMWFMFSFKFVEIGVLGGGGFSSDSG